MVGALFEQCERENLPHPDIITESGRAMTAHHAVLITQVTDREGDAPQAPAPAVSGHPLLRSLSERLRDARGAAPAEVFEEARDLLRQAREEFEAGRLGLEERAAAEDLFLILCRELKDTLSLASRRQRELLEHINTLLAAKLFCNFSLFQSVPDIWGIEQIFPVVPLQRLHEEPSERAVVHDLTCDSDGCIDQYVDQDGIEASLPVHPLRPGEHYR